VTFTAPALCSDAQLTEQESSSSNAYAYIPTPLHQSCAQDDTMSVASMDLSQSTDAESDGKTVSCDFRLPTHTPAHHHSCILFSPVDADNTCTMAAAVSVGSTTAFNVLLFANSDITQAAVPLAAESSSSLLPIAKPSTVPPSANAAPAWLSDRAADESGGDDKGSQSDRSCRASAQI